MGKCETKWDEHGKILRKSQEKTCWMGNSKRRKKNARKVKECEEQKPRFLMADFMDVVNSHYIITFRSWVILSVRSRGWLLAFCAHEAPLRLTFCIDSVPFSCLDRHLLMLVGKVLRSPSSAAASWFVGRWNLYYRFLFWCLKCPRLISTSMLQKKNHLNPQVREKKQNNEK